MNWYLTKIVYQIVCGKGNHTAQFDEQLRLIEADNEDQAFDKAVQIGRAESETFTNDREELVQWKFVNVADLYRLSSLVDGAELYSRIQEAEDEASYLHAVHTKAASIRAKTSLHLLNLI
jgi:hypothetical protein